jgi:hypothetical protein
MVTVRFALDEQLLADMHYTPIEFTRELRTAAAVKW